MLVFTSNRTGEDEIFIGRLTANNRLVDLVQLTDAPGIQAFPALSGASDYLLYHSEGAENWLIHDCRILTGESQPITDTGDNLFPALSPDGLRYAYASTRDDNWELYLYTPETGIEERLTEDPAADLYAAFSPDDTALVFSSKRGDGATYDLYTLDLETGEVAELLVDPAVSLIYPAWYPGVFFYHIQRGEHSRIGWLDTDSGETGELDLLPGVDLGHPAFLPAMDRDGRDRFQHTPPTVRSPAAALARFLRPGGVGSRRSVHFRKKRAKAAALSPGTRRKRSRPSASRYRSHTLGPVICNEGHPLSLEEPCDGPCPILW